MSLTKPLQIFQKLPTLKSPAAAVVEGSNAVQNRTKVSCMLRMCEPPLKRGCGLLTAAVAAAAVGGGNVDARSAKIRAVFIIGATGTGKSKLGIQLAQKFGGEIVNADALQMYEGLDIATAKVTKEEMCGVPHHLMSFLGPTESWTVHKYRNAAREVIAEVGCLAVFRSQFAVCERDIYYIISRTFQLNCCECHRAGCWAWEAADRRGRHPVLRPVAAAALLA